MLKSSKIATAVALTAGILALSATAASARIVCNEDGDCWHSHEDFVVAPGLQLNVHPDDWQFGEDHHHRWREHEGRGYWRGGNWVEMH
jgi:hypothetical protein